MKIIALGWPWRSLTTSTVGYLSDGWTSCLYFFRNFFTSMANSNYMSISVVVWPQF